MATDDSNVPPATDAKTEASLNSPPRASAPRMTRPPSGPARPRLERPVEPPRSQNAFNIPYAEEVIIGNPKFVNLMKIDGHLGTFYRRDQINRIPEFFEIKENNYYNAIVQTLTAVIESAFKDEGNVDLQDVEFNASDLAQSLARGVCVLTYLKIRSNNCLFYSGESPKFYEKPMVPTHFEVPEPYALAISQLGLVKPSGLTEDRPLAPSASPDAASRFLLPVGVSWSAARYARDVEIAKRLKIRFNTVDLSVKMGSTWWLYVPAVANNKFQLHCPLPEENFTETSALLATLFCTNNNGGFLNPLFDLNQLNDRYGTMLINPPARIDLSTFYAVESVATDTWKMS